MPYVRARWVARGASVGFTVLAVILARAVAVLVGTGGMAPLAMLPFLALCTVAVLGWIVLGRLWRRVGDLRPVVLPVDAGAGALQGAPERDAADGHHRSLSGELEPPTRW
ncbi:hypothetical protein ASF78_01990 [Cellulomonas sp. Leaf334]|nr:hypothetical protein ASF78_01990 [Cellulomonas sp. Leaf334]